MTGAAHLPKPSAAAVDDRSLFERLRYTPLLDVLRGHITGQLDFAREIRETNLPGSLPELVIEVTKKTRLWRSEKADVARELIAHFRDGLEAGAQPADLAGMFGDPSRSAKLIRRAKKRNRPLIWRAMRNTVRGAAIMVGLLLGFYLIIGARFLIGRPSPSINFLPQINAPAIAVPESQRAWPLYRESLLELGVQPETAIDTAKWNRRPRPGEEGWQEFEAYLLQHQSALAKARAAASIPGLGYVADHGVTPEDLKLWPGTTPISQATGDEGLYSILLPYLGSLRLLSQTLRLDVERSAAKGDGTTVAADLSAMLGIARHVRELPLLINDLVSLAIFNLAAATLNDVLATWPDSLTDAQLHELAHRLATWGDSMLKVRLDGERIGFDDILQRIYTDDGHGDGRLTREGMRTLASLGSLSQTSATGFGRDPIENLAGPAICEIVLGRKAMHAEFQRLLNLAATDASQPMWNHDQIRLDSEVAAMVASPIERLRKWPVVMLMPAIGKAWENSERSILARDTTLTALALTLYHRQNSAWPRSLDELTPRWLPAIPVDRFDGKPLKYTVIGGKPIVYSVARDRDDDGGKELTGLRTAAQRWEPLNQDARQGSPRALPDYGDWVLWPTQVEPLSRFRDDLPWFTDRHP